MKGTDRQLLVFGTDFPPEMVGTATYAHALASGLHARGIRVTVLAQECLSADAMEFDRQQPFPIIRMRRRRSVAEAYVHAYCRLKNVLAAAQFDCLWTTNGMSTRVVGLAGNAVNVPVISSIRGTDLRTRLPGRGILRRLESLPQRRCYRYSVSIAAASRYLKDLAVSKGVDGERIFVALSAIPIELTLASVPPRNTESDLSVVTVARLTEQKRLKTALSAMAIVQQQLPSVKYTIVGDGPERARLEALASASNPSVRVRFEGAVPAQSERLYDFYRGADLFLLTSKCEGLANVFLEAGAFGLASVGSLSGGVPEAVIDGETGLLVEADDPQQVADRVLWLLAHHDQRQQMGARARAHIQSTFSIDALADRCLPVLQKVLTNTDPATGAGL